MVPLALMLEAPLGTPLEPTLLRGDERLLNEVFNLVECTVPLALMLEAPLGTPLEPTLLGGTDERKRASTLGGKLCLAAFFSRAIFFLRAAAASFSRAILFALAAALALSAAIFFARAAFFLSAAILAARAAAFFRAMSTFLFSSA